MYPFVATIQINVDFVTAIQINVDFVTAIQINVDIFFSVPSSAASKVESSLLPLSVLPVFPGESPPAIISPLLQEIFPGKSLPTIISPLSARSKAFFFQQLLSCLKKVEKGTSAS